MHVEGTIEEGWAPGAFLEPIISNQVQSNPGPKLDDGKKYF